MKKLPLSYFQEEDTLAISRSLLGKFLVSISENKTTSGMIIETEAYLGSEDRACHAFRRRRTKRTEVMYLPGGHWYVYLCYGMHSLLNIVTHRAEEPHAILIRAIEPCEGIEHMIERRQVKNRECSVALSRLASGPGLVSCVMGLTTQLTGEVLGKTTWIEDRGVILPENTIITGPRVGVSYAQEDALLPYRFRIKNGRQK